MKSKFNKNEWEERVIIAINLGHLRIQNGLNFVALQHFYSALTMYIWQELNIDFNPSSRFLNTKSIETIVSWDQN